MFTDFVGSTEQRSVLGDVVADTLLREHDRIVRRAAEVNAGAVIVGTGDGAMLAFAGAADAVDAAVAIQRAVQHHNRFHDEQIGLRIGISLGDLAAEDGELHGIAAAEAARVCAIANAGEILLSDVVRVVAGTRLRHQIVDHGVHELKGLPAPTRVWRVLWEPADDEWASPFPFGWNSY
ncbi:MAG TPA: hypothetical protein VN636_15680 [Acidimicrobiia bacterium]|nr:hypothetical protein [Acidimicrobiia bacterium]